MIKFSDSKECIYSIIGEFHYGLAKVRNNTGKWGFISKGAGIVASCIYDEVRDFSDGMAAVCKDGKWGFINTKGKLVIPCIYLACDNFVSGATEVKLSDDSWGFINREGFILTKYKGDNFDNKRILIYQPSEEEMKEENKPTLFPCERDGKWGYRNTFGEIVIDYTFKQAGRFSEGVAPVTDMNNERYYIDSNNNAAINLPTFYKSYVNDDDNYLTMSAMSKSKLHEMKISYLIRRKEEELLKVRERFDSQIEELIGDYEEEEKENCLKRKLKK